MLLTGAASVVAEIERARGAGLLVSKSASARVVAGVGTWPFPLRSPGFGALLSPAACFRPVSWP